ncbi:Excisionase family DNA binding domain-containing protein [Candidatus Sulfopaludibacter sp. SbA3]|nr:Excisionase family DNA binding domain-containing protein [Candidatus Sulfopaludibacter sp. SbA3]
MQLLTLAECARRLGVSEKTARQIAKALPAVRVGKRYRYPADAVAAFASTPTVGTSTPTERTEE